MLTERLNYEEDHGLMDIRLIICGLAVAVAMFALAWDYFYPFPASRYGILMIVKFLFNKDRIYNLTSIFVIEQI